MNAHTILYDFLADHCGVSLGKLDYSVRDGVVYWTYEDKPVPDGIAEGYVENLGMADLQSHCIASVLAEQSRTEDCRVDQSIYRNLVGYVGDGGSQWVAPSFFEKPSGQKMRTFKTRAAAIVFLLSKRYRYLWPDAFVEQPKIGGNV
jgi:hypothetical protein